jgi:ribonuclease E
MSDLYRINSLLPVFLSSAPRLHPTYVHAMNNLGNILKEREEMIARATAAAEAAAAVEAEAAELRAAEAAEKAAKQAEALAAKKAATLAAKKEWDAKEKAAGKETKKKPVKKDGAADGSEETVEGEEEEEELEEGEEEEEEGEEEGAEGTVAKETVEGEEGEEAPVKKKKRVKKVVVPDAVIGEIPCRKIENDDAGQQWRNERM